MLILWTMDLAAESPLSQRESPTRRSKGDTYAATIRAPKADQLTPVVTHLVRGVRSRFDSWMTTLEAKSRPALFIIQDMTLDVSTLLLKIPAMYV
jgi:hypothetical protein